MVRQTKRYALFDAKDGDRTTDQPWVGNGYGIIPFGDPRSDIDFERFYRRIWARGFHNPNYEQDNAPGGAARTRRRSVRVGVLGPVDPALAALSSLPDAPVPEPELREDPETRPAVPTSTPEAGSSTSVSVAAAGVGAAAEPAMMGCSTAMSSWRSAARTKGPDRRPWSGRLVGEQVEGSFGDGAGDAGGGAGDDREGEPQPDADLVVHGAAFRWRSMSAAGPVAV